MARPIRRRMSRAQVSHPSRSSGKGLKLILIGISTVSGLIGIVLFLLLLAGQAIHEKDRAAIESGRAKRIQVTINERWEAPPTTRKSTRYYLKFSDGADITKSREVSKAFWDRVSQGDQLEAYVIDNTLVIPALDKGVPSSAHWIVLVATLLVSGTPLVILLFLRRGNPHT